MLMRPLLRSRTRSAKRAADIPQPEFAPGTTLSLYSCLYSAAPAEKATRQTSKPARPNKRFMNILPERVPEGYKAAVIASSAGKTTTSAAVLNIQQALARSRSSPYSDGGMSAFMATGMADTISTVLRGSPPSMAP